MMKINNYSNSQDKEDFLKRFSVIPRKLYPTRPLPPDEYWSLLISEFKQLNKELFILELNGEDIGRIGCNISQAYDATGFFGFFEIKEQHKHMAKELINAAQEWLKANQAKTVIGPIDFNVWLGNRFKQSQAKADYSWEPNNPSFYPDLFLENGYHLDQGYISMLYDDSNLCYERTKSAYSSAQEQGYTLRNLDLKRPNEVDTLYALNLKSFKINYMYEPISREQYEAIHIRGVQTMDLQYSFFILNPEGIEIGYVFSFIDTSGEQIVKSILMDPKFQGARLASALLHAAVRQGRINGHKQCIGAMVRKGNVSEHFFDHLQKPTARHEYTLVKKAL
ncbi:MAG: GNAT family N-acetyltransferase [Bacteriovoracaceae bacterium]|nr:GNAT family N-acetyltransferase [Bacteriovoracaceae bacterium]